MSLTRTELATFACFILTSISGAAELPPGNAYSLRLSSFEGVVYHTIERDGYRVVATLAAGADELPIRFISTLGPGERMLLATPQAAGRPALELEIVRHGNALFVRDTVPAAPDLANDAAARAAP